MVEHVVDWEALRVEYETGDYTQSALSKKYGVSRTAIQKRIFKEQWQQVAGCRLQVAGAPPRPPVVFPHLPPPPDAVSIARAGLKQLAESLGDNPPATLLSLHDHKLLSDSLSQYVKVLVNAPPVEEERQEDDLFIPLSRLSSEARAKIRLALVENEQERAG